MGKYLDVGLTGAIACGKSLVLSIFKALGCPVLDADRIYHDLIAPGMPLNRELVKEFGSGIQTADGSIDRGALGRIVFNDAAARERLNRLTHPAVVHEQKKLKDEIRKNLKKQGIDQAVIVTDAALMIEAGTYRSYDKIVVVACETEIQVRRLMARGTLDEAEARRRIAAQMSSVEKTKFADYVIANNGAAHELIRAVETVYAKLCEDAR